MTFFFSSRRRHTRSYGDWSSDVCSSDLLQPLERELGACGRRKEGIRGDGDRGVEIEGAREIGDAIGRAVEKRTRVSLRADADDLAHRERPPALERRVTTAFVPPAFRLR